MKPNLSRLFNIFFIAALIAMAGGLASCNQKPSAETPAVIAPAVTTSTGAVIDSAKPKFTTAMVDNKKDPNCGMPLTAGILDTVHYKGKVYGFCSDECKQAFLKNPSVLATDAVMK